MWSCGTCPSLKKRGSQSEMLTRRHLVQTGGVFLAGLASTRLARATPEDVVEIQMRGNADGSEVWFDPIGVLVRPGQTVRWINVDAGNSHTATAYHPSNSGHALRIPEEADPWNSDYLLPEEAFSITLTREGVYDYFCVPHEMAGMVGRIVVAQPSEAGAQKTDPQAPGAGEPPLPEAAQHAFPSVEEIMRAGLVRRT